MTITYSTGLRMYKAEAVTRKGEVISRIGATRQEAIRLTVLAFNEAN